MSTYEKLLGVSAFVLLIGCGYLIHTSANDRLECAKVAMSQKYEAEQIRKICH